MEIKSSVAAGLAGQAGLGGVSGKSGGASRGSVDEAFSGSVSSGSTGKDAVSLSHAGGLLASATTPSSADVDVNKVASIKDAIAKGTYQPDAGKIADGLLSHAQSLLSAKSN